MKRKRKTVSVLAAAVVTAALLGGQVYPAWAGYEKKIEKSSLFPDSVTIETPTELENVSLPKSDYGTLSWYDETYVPTKRVETCKVKLKPFRSVDLSGYSGWDEEKGVLISKVTVVTLSLEGDDPEETTGEPVTEETSENGGTAETELSSETSTAADSAAALETSVSEEVTAAEEINNSENKTVLGESDAFGETAVTDETAETEETADTEMTAETEETADMEVTADTEETAETEETADTEMTTDTEETADTQVTADTEETADAGEAADTEETDGVVQTVLPGITPEADSEECPVDPAPDAQSGEEVLPSSENTQIDDAEQESSENELPGGILLVPLAPSGIPGQEQSASEAVEQSEASGEQTKLSESEQPGASVDQTGLENTEQSGGSEEDSRQDETSGQTIGTEENLSAQEQAERAALNHTSCGITVSGADLPWYVQFRVTEGSDYEFSNEEGAAVFSSYEFQLWDLKNNTEYEIPDGQYISVTIPVKEGYSYTIEHILDNGAIETIVPSVSGGTMVFSTHSFSPFGIAGTRLLVGEEIAEMTYSDTTIKATVTPTPTMTPTPTPTSAAGTAAGSTNTKTTNTGTTNTKTTNTGTTNTGTTNTGTTNTGTTNTGTTNTGTTNTGTTNTGTTSAGTGTANKGTAGSGNGSSGSGLGSTGASAATASGGAVKTADETPVGAFGILAAVAAGIAGLAAVFKKKRSL